MVVGYNFFIYWVFDIVCEFNECFFCGSLMICVVECEKCFGFLLDCEVDVVVLVDLLEDGVDFMYMWFFDDELLLLMYYCNLFVGFEIVLVVDLNNKLLIVFCL